MSERTDLDDRLNRMCADGQCTTDEADVIREFNEFLGKVGSPSDRSPEGVRRRRRALIEHADLCGLSSADVARLRAADEEATDADA